MKLLASYLILFLIPLLYAPNSATKPDKIGTLPALYEYDKTKLWFMDKLALVESGNNSKAVNKKSGAIGKYQILPGRDGALTYFNTFNPKGKQYTKNDMFDPYKNTEVAVFDLEASLSYFKKLYPYLPKEHIEILAINAFNAGRDRTERGIIFTNYIKNVLGDKKVNIFLAKPYATNLQGYLKIWHNRSKM